VGGVGDEVSLGVEGGFEAGEQVVQDVAKFGQLVGGLAGVARPAKADEESLA
jgi:hypothetical protein